jgi:LysM repeat protein/ABC-type branched-subunit amino acid transport system substrate-binding protein
MNFIKYSILFLTVLFAFNSFAQEELKTETISGKKYYLHTVEQGHTLYAISKKYLVEIDDIITENPEVKEGLKVGMVIKIPFVKENKKLIKANTPDLEGSFLLHIVEQGQTLYSLSKKYNIEIQDILAENPEIDGPLKIGNSIKIPVAKVKDLKDEAMQPARSDNWQQHIVQKGETLYSLAKQYDVNLDSINIVNNHFPNGLRIGDTINIPRIIEELIDDTISSASQPNKIYNYIKEKLRSSLDTSVIQLDLRTIKIGLLLPFFIDENEYIAETKKPVEKESIYPQSLISLEFYQGFLIALDSIATEKFNIQLQVYDTGKDTITLKKILQKPEFKSVDLIIGPLYLYGFQIASQFAHENNIHIVSPVIQQNSIIKNNSLVSKLSASQNIQIAKTSEYISEKFPSENIILINSGKENEKSLLKSFNKNFKPLTENKVKEINYITSGFSGVQNSMSANKINLIVIPSNDQAIITEIITKLNYLASQNKIIIFGLESWLEFDNLDVSYLHKLNTHIVTSSYIDYDNEDVKRFVLKNRQRFHTDPSQYAFLGYDTGILYLSLLRDYGKHFSSKYQNLQHSGLQTTFNLVKHSSDSGYENHGVYIIKYEDFSLKRADGAE